MIVTINGVLASRCAHTVAVVVFLITASISGALHAEQSNTDCASVSDTNWGGVNRHTLCVGTDRDGNVLVTAEEEAAKDEKKRCEEVNKIMRDILGRQQNKKLDDLNIRKKNVDKWIDEMVEKRESQQKEVAECPYDMVPDIKTLPDAICSIIGAVDTPIGQLCACILQNDRLKEIDKELESWKRARDRIQNEIEEKEACLADPNLCHSAGMFIDCDKEQSRESEPNS